MWLQHVSTAYPHDARWRIVTSCAWAPDGSRFACSVLDAGSVYINIFDSNGRRQDKFMCKPRAADAPSFAVTCIVYGPDSERLAVAGSDGLVTVYRTGKEFNAKKSAFRRFEIPDGSVVTSVVWPLGDIVYFSGSDGTVYAGDCTTNKVSVLAERPSPIVSLTSRPHGSGARLLAVHMDGSVVLVTARTGRAQGLARLAGVPTAATLTDTHALVAVSGGTIHCVPLEAGYPPQTLETGGAEALTAATAPSGRVAAVGCVGSTVFLRYFSAEGVWRATPAPCTGAAIGALAWAPTESRVVLCSQHAGVEVFDTVLRRLLVAERFEVTQLSLSQLLIRDLGVDGQSYLLRSADEAEISQFNVYHGHYVVARTSSSLLLADLASAQLSEVPWSGSGESVTFDDNVAIIAAASELTAVVLGGASLVPVHASSTAPHLRSVRIIDTEAIAAVLADQRTVRVVDLTSGAEIYSWTAPHPVTSLALAPSGRAAIVLAGDALAVLRTAAPQAPATTAWTTASAHPLPAAASYAAWVPGADVVVAQSGSALFTWYSLGSSGPVPPATVTAIEGRVTGIVRADGVTTVKTDGPIAGYKLDEPLLGFAAAITTDAAAAAAALEGLAPSAEVSSMWRAVAALAAESSQLDLAAIAAGAAGDAAAAAFLAAQPVGDPVVAVAARAVLQGDLGEASDALVSAGRVDDALDLLVSLGAWTEALDLAERARTGRATELASQYEQWLSETSQFDLLGELRERQGATAEAVELYLQGGAPARAAALVCRSVTAFDSATVEKVTSALTSARCFGPAAVLFEQLRMTDRAVAAYVDDEDFASAMRVATAASFPEDAVNRIQVAWGAAHARAGRAAEAVKRYVAGGALEQAVTTAVGASLWPAAAKIIVRMTPNAAAVPARRVAAHFASEKRYSEAEKLYLHVGAVHECVEMLAEVGRAADARRVACGLGAEQGLRVMHELAQAAARARRHGAAESLYMCLGDYSAAELMYINVGLLSDALRVVRAAHAATGDNNALTTSLGRIGEAHAHAGQLRRAETVWCSAPDGAGWRRAFDAYVRASEWAEAVRVATRHAAGPAQTEAVGVAAMYWAQSDPAAVAAAGLAEVAVRHAARVRDFELAVGLCHTLHTEHLENEVLARQAEAAQADGDIGVAVDTLLAAGRPLEAVRAACRAGEFGLARRVAADHCPDALAEVDDAAGEWQDDENEGQGMQAGNGQAMVFQARAPVQPQANKSPSPSPSPSPAAAPAAAPAVNTNSMAAVQAAAAAVRRRDFFAACDALSGAVLHEPAALRTAAAIAAGTLRSLVAESPAAAEAEGPRIAPVVHLLSSAAESCRYSGTDVPATITALRTAAQVALARATFTTLGERGHAARAAIALCRYGKVVPLSSAILCAGRTARVAAEHDEPALIGTAFALLNAAIDVADTGSAVSGAFDGTDVDLGLCQAFPAPPAGLDADRDWVLRTSLEYSPDDLQLLQRRCSECGGALYAGQLRCPHCSAVAAHCGVTGWPLGANVAQCPVCNISADAGAWQAVRRTGRCTVCRAAVN